MIKRKFLLCSLLTAGMSIAQTGRVGVNTENPRATLDVSKKTGIPSSQPQGVIFPHITTAERDTFTNIKEGTMIYNTTLNCVQYYDGTKWSCTDGSQSAYIAPTLPSTVTLESKQHTFISVYDEDYLPFSVPTAASWSAKPADGTNETKILDYQGQITTAAISVRIPISATASGVLPAYSIEASIGNSKTQDGLGGKVQLSWASQPYTTATTHITATLRAIGNTVNIKKLDLNGGLGTDYQGLELAKFALSKDGSKMFSLRVIPAIPDKSFGKLTNGVLEHQFFYLPVVGPDGKTWLNNDLGAEYANLNSPNFSPTQTAKHKDDYLAFGSLFQWQRPTDGHELITHTSATSLTFKYTPFSSALATSWENLGTNVAMGVVSGAGHWVTPAVYNDTTKHNLWRTNTNNNPCPEGFIVPTHAMFTAMLTPLMTTPPAYSSVSSVVFADTPNAAPHVLSNQPYYWTSEIEPPSFDKAYFLHINHHGSYFNTSLNSRVIGRQFNVRCVAP